MEPKKGKDKEANGGLSVSDESGSNNGADSESKQSRRQFTKNIGGLIFGLTLVDRTASYVFACPSCSNPGDNDANCNSPGDPDAGCGGGNEDEGCSASNEDQNCHTKDPGEGEGDEDQSCGSLGADEGCGDCNDAHDDDDNCGEPLGGGTDPDAMCGHAHASGIDTDDNCQNVDDNDQGCGIHTGPWGTEEDDDEGCNPGPPDTDQNCDEEDSDDNCNTNGPNTSTPDEHCGTAPEDHDSACEQYFDIDESCTAYSGNDMDESCGGKDTSAYPIIVSDEDQNCGHDFGGGVFDHDDRCGLPRTWPLPDWPDNTL